MADYKILDLRALLPLSGAWSIIALTIHLRRAEEPKPAQTTNSLTRHVPLIHDSSSITRLIGCVLLPAFSCLKFIKSDDRQFVDYFLCLSDLYNLIIIYICIYAGPRLARRAETHITVLLFIQFHVYAFRDIWPLATTDSLPADRSDGWLIIARILVLVLIGIIVPLFFPQELLVMPAPSSHTTRASLWSRLTYSYLDNLIIRASRANLSSMHDLPTLSHADQARTYIENNKILDPLALRKNNSLFFSILLTFRQEYISLCLLHTLQTCLSFVTPLALNQVLKFLENKLVQPAVHQWVWVSCLFLGPFIRVIVSQRYTCIASRVMVRSEGLLTQLLMAHSLRLRVATEAQAQSIDQGSSQFIGKINNLVTSDLTNIMTVTDVWLVVLLSPGQVALSIWFLYRILDWSAIVGLVVMILYSPIPAYFTTKLRDFQSQKMKKTDARIQKVVELLTISRMIKLFGWERKMEDEVAHIRAQEFISLRKIKLLELVTENLNFLVPLITMMTTYATFTVIMQRELSASLVFSSIAVFELLRLQIRHVLGSIPNVIQGKISLDRLDDFLKHAPLLDEYSCATDSDQQITESCSINEANKIGFQDSMFSWGNALFTLKIEGTLLFEPGINLITGPTGSGKTSLLMALLGEMKFQKMTLASWFNLPRQLGVALAPQEYWIQNDTIKNNIVFASPFDEDRYNKAMFECGDRTEVGEKGVTLSGGQKARITLARAIYSGAKILLLDDILAALDVQTANWIVEKCFSGALVEGRTILLVTHNVTLMGPIVKHVICIGSDGTVIPLTDTEKEAHILNRVNEGSDTEGDSRGSLTSQTFLKDGGRGKTMKTLISPEALGQGRIQWAAYKLYFSNISSYPRFFWLLVTATIFCNEGCLALQSWFLGFWASKYEDHNASDVAAAYYLSIHAGLIFLSVFFYSCCHAVFHFGSLRASTLIHMQLINSIFHSKWRWLDTTPTSRIIARATQDIQTIEGPLAEGVKKLLDLNIGMLVRFGLIVTLSPAYLLPGILVACLGAYIGQLYMAAQLPVKRMMSNAKSPILSHFSTVMTGLVPIRAFGAQEQFLSKSMSLIDVYSHVAATYWDLNRWISVRSEVLGGLFTAGLGTYCVYLRTDPSPEQALNIGFSLTMAVGFSSMILTWVRMINNVELSANSLERLLQYISIPQETNNSNTLPPAHWPTSGELIVENLSARYSDDGPEILHNLSFKIKSGERIGIVGRTGAGKTSLALSLLQCIPTTGNVFYDGLLTSSLDKPTLRSSMTIIPQHPELLNGTLRSNLDPFGELDDATLHSALHAAGLHSLRGQNIDEVMLDMQVSNGGQNISVGQRQVVALARAIVRGSKLLILDEATSSVDFWTDSVIQSTIRNDLKGVTVMTIAHRLRTVMDFDRIMVLEGGQMVEFDTPLALLQKEDGLLHALVNESADKDLLYAIGEGVYGSTALEGDVV